MRFLKVLFVSILSVIAMWAANLFLGRIGVQLGRTSTLALYAAIAFAILYLPAPKRRWYGGRKKVEYVLNGQGQLTGKLFDQTTYTGYSVVEETPDGRILSDATGRIICTQYAYPGQVENGLSHIHLIWLCLVSVGLSIMFENLFLLIQTGKLESSLIRWSHQMVRLKPELLFRRIRMNILSLFKTLRSIKIDIDIMQCFEIIKNNLERLSILQFK